MRSRRRSRRDRTGFCYIGRCSSAKVFQYVLLLDPKHPIRNKFDEVHFLAEVEKLVRDLRENNIDGEMLCEIKSSGNRYAKNLWETPMDRGIKKVFWKVF